MSDDLKPSPWVSKLGALWFHCHTTVPLDSKFGSESELIRLAQGGDVIR